MPDQEQSPGVLDREGLLERVDGDAEFLWELAGVFDEDCPKLLAQMKAAIETHNATALERAAHTMKGSVANFGAGTAREAAFRLERIGREGELSQAPRLYADLEREIATFRVALETLARVLMRQG